MITLSQKFIKNVKLSGVIEHFRRNPCWVVTNEGAMTVATADVNGKISKIGFNTVADPQEQAAILGSLNESMAQLMAIEGGAEAE